LVRAPPLSGTGSAAAFGGTVGAQVVAQTPWFTSQLAGGVDWGAEIPLRSHVNVDLLVPVLDILPSAKLSVGGRLQWIDYASRASDGQAVFLVGLAF
jgi:hypothetical protein